MMKTIRDIRAAVLGGLLVLAWPSMNASAEIVMKVLIANPSESEVKEFPIRYPLPPEIKAEHVLDAHGLKVDYDAQEGVYVLVGTVTLKPKESVTKRILLQDVWIISEEQIARLRSETGQILEKLTGSGYAGQGRLLGDAIDRRLKGVVEQQDQPFLSPQQHITGYREAMETLQLVESDLVSMRQLMVMAALNPKGDSGTPPPAAAQASGGVIDTGSLSVLTTWRLIFFILGLLGFVSLSFFLVWHRQLKLQLAKQEVAQAQDPLAGDELLMNGNGKLQAVPPAVAPRVQPKNPISS